LTTKNRSAHHSKRSRREMEREGKESDAVSGRESKEKAEVENAKEEERQQAKVTGKVAGTNAPYVDPPNTKAYTSNKALG
jgi:hypothetical protein